MKTELIVILIFLVGCNVKPKPQFTINGKSYYTVEKCVESQVLMLYEWKYEYNLLTGNTEYHFGPSPKINCVKSVIDTIEIKN